MRQDRVIDNAAAILDGRIPLVWDGTFGCLAAIYEQLAAAMEQQADQYPSAQASVMQAYAKGLRGAADLARKLAAQAGAA